MLDMKSIVVFLSCHITHLCIINSVETAAKQWMNKTVTWKWQSFTAPTLVNTGSLACGQIHDSPVELCVRLFQRLELVSTLIWRTCACVYWTVGRGHRHVHIKVIHISPIKFVPFLFRVSSLALPHKSAAENPCSGWCSVSIWARLLQTSYKIYVFHFNSF